MIFVIGKRAMEDNSPESDGEDGDQRAVKAYKNYGKNLSITSIIVNAVSNGRSRLDMEPTMVAVKSAIRKNAKFRLLLSLLHFEKTEGKYVLWFICNIFILTR
jgi:hypothetical protein